MIRLSPLKAAVLAVGAFAVPVSVGLSVSAEPVPYNSAAYNNSSNGSYNGTSSQYDGYCYSKKVDTVGQNAAIGAAAGALAGSLLGKKKKKTQSAVIGAALGAGAGYIVAKNSKEKVECVSKDYYVFDRGYYEPADAPAHQRVVFFEERPADVNLFVVRKGRVVPYRGR
ncbi:MAG: glycine zipper 2TM domain-containing protein [Asticcacaulis sp.]